MSELEATARDRLSELPDHLLHRILLFLDTRQVVRELSRLSRRWRYLWVTSPYVNLQMAYRDGYEKFGNLLLLLRDGMVPLHTFCLHSWYRKHFQYEHSCATLGEFNLTATAERNEIIAPRSVCLPYLKKLHLKFVIFQDPSVVEKLESGCPALEDLSLSWCSLGSFKISSDTLKILSITDCKYDEIHISAPNVRSLKLTVSGKVQVEDVPFLVSAWVYLCDEGAHNLVQDGYNLTAALISAQHLELFRFNLFLQNMMGNSAHETLSFSKLKTLYIGERRVTDFYGSFAYFLECAPCLASLTLDQWKLHEKHNWKVPSLESMEKKPKVELKLVSALNRDLETLLIRLSKSDDIEEFRKVRRLLKEKTKPKEIEIVWF
ncbi:unnamed protein product [Urochloa humidicola]